MKETDLYPHVKKWLEDGGYAVHAEVEDCDVAARRGDDLILIEIKRAITLDLLLQLTRRQEAADSVYAAVPAPAGRNARWRGLTRLLQRLGAGLLLVHVESALPGVELAFHPIPQGRRKSVRKTRAILDEMAGRSIDLNLGGSNRRKRMTAYREQALAVAVCLDRTGRASPKQLRGMGAPPKAGAILRDNHYGWFERKERGVYDVTAAGRRAVVEYASLAARLKTRIVVPDEEN